MNENIKIEFGTDNINWNQLFQLYKLVGLVAGNGKSGNVDNIKKSFLNSYKVVSVQIDEQIVGAGRMISDGVCYGMIFDVGVLPEFQKNGIGKIIMHNLLKDEDKLFIHLTSTFGNELFYQKLGFKRHKTAMAKYPYTSEYLED